jgi:hypothetical protein
MSQSKTLSLRGNRGPSPVRWAVWLLSLSALLSLVSVLEYLIVVGGEPQRDLRAQRNSWNRPASGARTAREAWL